ncbi:MAG TPA: hypothetical protein VMH39_00230 [Gemmatimonadaceae bacterium]|nr:hypothetical protein [Gemmatimonadaceae bacterium]
MPMCRRHRAGVAWCLLVGLIAARVAAAQDTSTVVHIGLTYNPAAPPTISVVPVVGPNGDSIQAVIERDLVNSDRFTVVPLEEPDTKAYRDSTAAGGLNYPLFKALRVREAVQVIPTAGGLHVVLYDVDSARVAVAKDFAIPAPALGREWRFALHGISDAIEQWITGERGIAATRIAYIRGGSPRVVDSDGAEDITVPTDSGPYCPAWSPDGATVAYNTIGRGRIMTVALATGRGQTIVPYLLNHELGGPHFTPSGDSIAFVRDDGSASELWIVSRTGTGARRIASLPAVNSNLSFSPDGRRLAFMTGRALHPQIYTMDADGANARMLTSILRVTDSTYNSDPAWSPNGLTIAFQSQVNGHFQLETITMRDTRVAQLTSDGENRHPSWAPDSRHLVFQSDRSGAQQLW